MATAALALMACSESEPGGTTGRGGSSGGTGTAAGSGGSTGAGTGSGGSTGGAGTTGSGGAGTTGAGGSATGTGGSGTGTGTGGSGAGGTGSGTGGTGTTTGAGGGTATGAGGTGPTTGTGGATGAGGASATLVWPNDMSKANSDTWLVTNHDKIARLEPRVLVIDLENTASAAALVDRHIAALKEATSFHKYKDPAAQPALSYQLLKVVQASKGTGTRIDYASWNTQAFADSTLQIKDPANPSGPNLTLCGLFEKGIINEVWCMASRDPKCGETQEAKQVYDVNGNKTAGRIVHVSNGDNITNLGCKVTTRITDFNSGRGTGCHQHAMGHAWERYMDASAVPALRKQAARFLNWDLMARGASFNNFYSACNTTSALSTDCMVWQSTTHVVSGPSAVRNFDLVDMSGGCGNAHYYPNTTGNYSYDANSPDPMVLTSCENYGLHNGAGGKDMTTPYTNAMTDQLYGRSPNPINGACPATATPACSDDCGGHGSTYLYQNFPGPGTRATNDDGTPMHNWWVYLFY